MAAPGPRGRRGASRPVKALRKRPYCQAEELRNKTGPNCAEEPSPARIFPMERAGRQGPRRTRRGRLNAAFSSAGPIKSPCRAQRGRDEWGPVAVPGGLGVAESTAPLRGSPFVMGMGNKNLGEGSSQAGGGVQ